MLLGSGRTVFGGDADSRLGGGTDGGVEGDGRDRDGDGLSRWEDNVAHITLGTDHNSFLVYAP